MRPSDNYNYEAEVLGKLQDFTSNKTYTLTCIGPGGTISKSIYIKTEPRYTVTRTYDEPKTVEIEKSIVKEGEKIKNETTEVKITTSSELPTIMSPIVIPPQEKVSPTSSVDIKTIPNIPTKTISSIKPIKEGPKIETLLIAKEITNNTNETSINTQSTSSIITTIKSPEKRLIDRIIGWFTRLWR